MTASNVVALRPPDNPPPGPEWKPIPGAGYYEASHRGKLRSVDRTIGGKSYKGVVLKTRVQNKVQPGDVQYELGDVRRDDGTKWTNTVHSFVLLAHVGEPGAGEETLHGPGGPLDNRWPENIGYGTKAANAAMKDRPVREPKPPALCVNYDRCGRNAGPGGRRCHECVVEMGQAGAALMEEGADPEQAAEMLGYASAVGLYRLAVKYGGGRFVVDHPAVTVSEPGSGHVPSPEPWLRRVIIRWKAWLADSDSP